MLGYFGQKLFLVLTIVNIHSIGFTTLLKVNLDVFLSVANGQRT